MCLARIPQRRQSNNTHTRHWRNSPTHTGIVSFQLMPSQERAGEPSRLYPGEHENLVMALSYRYIFSPLAICGRISHPDAVWEEEREGENDEVVGLGSVKERERGCDEWDIERWVFPSSSSSGSSSYLSSFYQLLLFLLFLFPRLLLPLVLLMVCDYSDLQ